ncbi:MAG: lytic transglycosylase domain-containing protein [Brevundimonas sp.]|nr:MAG: lytic transglycosylase domain-containing protein [Brevundimonas sp.]
MVRFGVIAVVLCACGPASAQQLDWRRAGGDLFGAPIVVPTEVVGSEPLARLEPLSQPYQAMIDRTALEHGLDPKLLHALIATESAYRPSALSPAGAGGLTQLMPDTARELGVADRFDPTENVRGGANYLAQQIRRFGSLELALAAYNSGPARVARLGRVPDIRETREYVRSVISCFLALTAGQAVTNAQQCRRSEASL